MDLELDRLYSKPQGTFSRQVNHDVESVDLIEDDNGPKLYITLNRDGIYDNLPEGLFHAPVSTDSFAHQTKQVQSKIQEENEKEYNARKFFQIFEDELLRLNAFNWLTVADGETKYFGKQKKSVLSLLPFDISIFTEKEQNRLIEILPFIHDFIGPDYLKLEILASFVIERKIEVAYFTSLSTCKASSKEYSTLGASHLGYDLCLSDTIELAEKKIKISILENNKDAHQVLYEKLNTLVEWLIPIHISVDFNMTTDAEENMVLGSLELMELNTEYGS